MNPIYVNTLKEIPASDHYAVIESTSVDIPGDERSRTHPGHGYPASTEYFIRYTAFSHREDLMIWLEKQTPEKRRNIRVLKIQSVPLTESFSLGNV